MFRDNNLDLELRVIGFIVKDFSLKSDGGWRGGGWGGGIACYPHFVDGSPIVFPDDDGRIFYFPFVHPDFYFFSEPESGDWWVDRLILSVNETDGEKVTDSFVELYFCLSCYVISGCDKVDKVSCFPYSIGEMPEY